MAGIGPATSPLPRECSTTEPHGPRYKLPFANIASPKPNVWSGRRGSNSRHSVWKTEALPTELHPLRTLTQSKPFLLLIVITINWWRRLDSNQRTQRERIYSPSPLTTRPPLLTEPAIMLIFWHTVKHKTAKNAQLLTCFVNSLVL